MVTANLRMLKVDSRIISSKKSRVDATLLADQDRVRPDDPYIHMRTLRRKHPERDRSRISLDTVDRHTVMLYLRPGAV